MEKVQNKEDFNFSTVEDFVFDPENIKLREILGTYIYNKKREYPKKDSNFDSNFVFDENTKNEATQIYLEYLKNIFPNTKIKGIFYHGTNREFDSFKRKHGLHDLSGVEGVDDFYFTNNKNLAEFFAQKYKRILFHIFDCYEQNSLDWFFKRDEPFGDFNKFNSGTIELWDQIYEEFLYIVKEYKQNSSLENILNSQNIEYFNNQEGLGFKFDKMFLPYYLMQDYFWYKKNPDGKILSVVLNIENPYIKNGDRNICDSVAEDSAIKRQNGENVDAGIQTDGREKNIVVFDKNQIHILGSEDDFAKLKIFLESKK